MKGEEIMVSPCKPLEEDPIQAFGFAGMNDSAQNPVVALVRHLVKEKSRQAVVDAIPTLSSSLDSNQPPLTVNEAHEIWNVLYDFYLRYTGGLDVQLEDLIAKIGNLFPDESFV